MSGVKELTAEYDKSSICGIGIAGQMHGLVILDKDDDVIRPAILWNDGRTDKETEYLNRTIGTKRLSELTANIAFAGFTAPKLIWLKANEPENFRKISKIMLPKDYLNYRLTGVHCTDYSDASGMLLLDVQNKCWAQDMLEICNISEDLLPKLYNSFEVTGTLLPEVAGELGLNAGTIVVAGAGDNAAAAVGTGTVGSGKCNISLGTSGTVFIPQNRFSPLSNNALHNFCHADGGWHYMGVVLSAASCNKWFCNEILGTDDYKAEESGITDDKLGNNHVFFLPYLMGERSPINDTNAKGLFIGMRMNTKRSDMVQAVLEGVAFAIRDSVEIVKQTGSSIATSTLCGGGAKSALWQKIMANVLNITIQIPATEEGPGLGAAMLAMVGCNEFSSVKEASKSFVKITKTVSPDPETVARYEKQYQKFIKIYPEIKNLYKEII